jgi:uncharacterized protein (DUF305 family)
VPPPSVRVALVAALLFLAGSVGYAVGTRTALDGDAPSAADVGFLQDMIAHHEQAIEMSQLALSQDLPPTVRSFAMEVVSDQRYEIGLMESTLREWGEPAITDDGRAMGWMGHESAVEEMPGMASPEELAPFSTLRGDAAASHWITLMSRHHEGGVEMATEGARRADDAFVQGLADRMARKQRTEINEYQLARERLRLS